jgi:hypothetical protein
MSDRFDGVPYIFKTDVPMSIPVEVATHILGWPGEPEYIRRHIAKRFGWNTPDDMRRLDAKLSADGTVVDVGSGPMRWETWVDKIEISPIHYELIERDPDAPIPADAGDPEEAPMGESEVPMPLKDHEAGDTHVGVRKRTGFVASKKSARRLDV